MKYISITSNNNNKNTNKLNLDQYYTPINIANYCINKTFEVLHSINCSISDILEPSAGAGSFSDILKNNHSLIAIDIEPKKDYILKADYLTYKLDYKKNRLIIGNPPYGSRLYLAKRFYEKSVLIGDYISFILPISQLNNTNSLYKFDLIYSEDLGEIFFSDNKKVHCCLNIYKRPNDNTLNKKVINKLTDITLIRQDQSLFKDLDNYDIRMCYLGNGSAGKILNEGEHYSSEYKIIIHNEELREDILNFLNTVDWKKEIKSTAMLSISKSQFTTVIKRYIPNIK